MEIAGAGLCHSDLSVVDGSRPRTMPMVMGHEASGIVREVGAEVREFAPGDHVVFSWVACCGRCNFCISARGALCAPGNAANIAGTLLSGARHFADSKAAINHHLGVSAFSQFTVAAQESLVKIDASVQLAPLLCSVVLWLQVSAQWSIQPALRRAARSRCLVWVA